MNGLASFVMGLEDPPKLKILVETLGFGHLHLYVTVPRVVIFRDAIMDLFSVELGERFTSQAREGWRKLLNYVGGAIIYVKANYAERINTLLASWKICNEAESNDNKMALEAEDDGSGKAHQEATQQAQKKKKGWFGGGSKTNDAAGTKE